MIKRILRVMMPAMVLAAMSWSCDNSCVDDIVAGSPSTFDGNVTVTPGEGTITLSWPIPEHPDYQYIRIEYTVNGERYVTLASSYADHVVIENLLHKYGEIEFTMQPYSMDDTPGQVYTARGTADYVQPVYTEVKAEMLDLYPEAYYADNQLPARPVGNLSPHVPGDFYHVQWNSGLTTPMPHYVVVDCGEDAQIEAFRFYYAGRNDGNSSYHNPNSMDVFVSNEFDPEAATDAEKFNLEKCNAVLVASYDETVLPNTPTSLPPAEFDSETIEADQPFRYVWLRVNSVFTNQPYFTMSELSITAVEMDVYDPEGIAGTEFEKPKDEQPEEPEGPVVEAPAAFVGTMLTAGQGENEGELKITWEYPDNSDMVTIRYSMLGQSESVTFDRNDTPEPEPIVVSNLLNRVTVSVTAQAFRRYDDEGAELEQPLNNMPYTVNGNAKRVSGIPDLEAEPEYEEIQTKLPLTGASYNTDSALAARPVTNLDEAVTGNFFHMYWADDANPFPHYIVVDCGADAKVTDFKFYYKGRSDGNGNGFNPDEMRVYVSDVALTYTRPSNGNGKYEHPGGMENDSDFEMVADLTGLPFGANPPVEYTSENLHADKGGRYVWFEVLKSNAQITGNSYWDKTIALHTITITTIEYDMSNWVQPKLQPETNDADYQRWYEAWLKTWFEEHPVE